MTAPIENDIEIIQGATFRMQVTWEDSTQDPAVAISLAGFRAHMQVRSKQGGTGTLYIDLSSLDGSLVVEPSDATGVVTVRIPATATATLTKNGFYDLFVVRNADESEATRLVWGAYTLSKSVTQG